MGFHLMAGLFITTVLLLFHSVPAFILSGVIGAVVDTFRDEPEAEMAIVTLVGFRRGLLRQSLIIVGVILCGAICGLAQIRQSVPPFVHGGVMAAVTLMHIFNWRRMAMVIAAIRRIFRDLQEIFGDEEADANSEEPLARDESLRRHHGPSEPQR